MQNDIFNKEDQKKDFSQNELLERWQDLIIFLRNEGKSNLAITLGINSPTLLEGFQIDVPLSNAAQVEMILDEKHMILEYLRDVLKNDYIELDTRVLEIEKNSVPYTNKDKFVKMLDDNSSLDNLRNKLGLDPDY